MFNLVSYCVGNYKNKTIVTFTLKPLVLLFYRNYLVNYILMMNIESLLHFIDAKNLYELLSSKLNQYDSYVLTFTQDKTENIPLLTFLMLSFSMNLFVKLNLIFFSHDKTSLA